MLLSYVYSNSICHSRLYVKSTAHYTATEKNHIFEEFDGNLHEVGFGSSAGLPQQYLPYKADMPVGADIIFIRLIMAMYVDHLSPDKSCVRRGWMRTKVSKLLRVVQGANIQCRAVTLLLII